MLLRCCCCSCSCSCCCMRVIPPPHPPTSHLPRLLHACPAILYALRTFDAMPNVLRPVVAACWPSRLRCGRLGLSGWCWPAHSHSQPRCCSGRPSGDSSRPEPAADADRPPRASGCQRREPLGVVEIPAALGRWAIVGGIKMTGVQGGDWRSSSSVNKDPKGAAAFIEEEEDLWPAHEGAPDGVARRVVTWTYTFDSATQHSFDSDRPHPPLESRPTSPTMPSQSADAGSRSSSHSRTFDLWPAGNAQNPQLAIAQLQVQNGLRRHRPGRARSRGPAAALRSASAA